MKALAETLGVSRSNLVERLKGERSPRRRYHKAHDAAVLPLWCGGWSIPGRRVGYRRIGLMLERKGIVMNHMA